jgi:Leucine-rich repeat (LRR) protein
MRSSLSDLVKLAPLLGEAWEKIICYNVQQPIIDFHSQSWKDVAYWQNDYHLDLDVLERFRNLKFVSAKLRDPRLSNTITTLLPLAYCENLKGLSSKNTNISSLEDVSHLQWIEYLDISSNILESLDCISHWNLKYLNFHYTYDPAIHNLSCFKNLKNLNIRYSKITNLSDLSELKQLEYLNIGYTGLTDINPLLELPNLKKVSCRGNNFKEDDIDNLTRINSVLIEH